MDFADPETAPTILPFTKFENGESEMLRAYLPAYVTGTVNQELLLRNEYLVAENRILRGQITGRLLLSEGEKATLADQSTVHFSCEHLSPVDESACNPKRKSLRQAEEILFISGTTNWRTTTFAAGSSRVAAGKRFGPSGENEVCLWLLRLPRLLLLFHCLIYRLLKLRHRRHVR
jgi:hypothetical protein